MKRVYFATTSDKKFKKLDKGLRKAWKDLGFNEEVEVIKYENEIQEPSKGLEKIAKLKVIKAYDEIRQRGLIEPRCVAWDSGFYIPCLGGFPAEIVKRYLDEKGVEDLFLKLRKKGFEDQLKNSGIECHFVHCLAYHPQDANAEVHVYKGKNAQGILVCKPRGKGNVEKELECYFQPTGENIPDKFAKKTIAEIRENEGLYNDYWDWRHLEHFKELAKGIKNNP